MEWVLQDHKSSVWYKADYDGSVVNLNPSSYKGLVEHYKDLHDGEEPDVVPTWHVEFDPTRFEVIDPTKRWINKYCPTPLRQATYEPNFVCPPNVEAILRSLTVEDTMFEHFLDCLAHVWQTGTPTRTAHLFRGTTGTGKGTLFREILVPLFGAKHCREIGMEVFDSNFNPWAEDKLFVMLDEGEIDDRNSARLINKCNNLITEHTIELHCKGRNTVPMPNFINLIVATNNRAPLKLPQEDRRWNVAPAQERSLKAQGYNVHNIKKIESELPAFAALLSHRQYDIAKVSVPLENDARQELFLSTETSIEQIFRAFREGDLDFFCEHFHDAPEDAVDATTILFRKSVVRWLREYRNGPVKLDNNECKAAYQFLTGQPISPVKFGRIASRRWTSARTVRDGDNVFKGWTVTFNLREERWKYKVLNEKPKLHAVR